MLYFPFGLGLFPSSFFPFLFSRAPDRAIRETALREEPTQGTGRNHILTTSEPEGLPFDEFLHNFHVDLLLDFFSSRRRLPACSRAAIRVANISGIGFESVPAH